MNRSDVLERLDVLRDELQGLREDIAMSQKIGFGWTSLTAELEAGVVECEREIAELERLEKGRYDI